MVYGPGIPDSCAALVQDRLCSVGCISRRWADPPLDAADGDGDGRVRICLLWLSLCVLRGPLMNLMVATVRPSPCSSLGAGEVKLESQCLGHNPQEAAPSLSGTGFAFWTCWLLLVKEILMLCWGFKSHP